MDSFSQKQNLLLGILITILAYFCFSISSGLVKGLNGNIPAIEIVFFQNLVGLICIIPYSLKEKTFSFKDNYWSFHLLRDICGTLSYFAYFFAIKAINLVDATALAYTAPFFTPLISKILLGGKLEKDVWWAIILGFLGIAFILKPGEHIFHFGSIIGISAGIFTSIALVSIRFLNKKHESLSRTLFYYFFIGTILTGPFLFFSWNMPTLYELFFLIGIGLAIVIGQFLLTIAYRHGTAAFLSPLCYFMIIFTGLISWIFFHHAPGWLTLIGTALIICGGTLSFLFRKKPKTFLKTFERLPEKKWWDIWKNHK